MDFIFPRAMGTPSSERGSRPQPDWLRFTPFDGALSLCKKIPVRHALGVNPARSSESAASPPTLSVSSALSSLAQWIWPPENMRPGLWMQGTCEKTCLSQLLGLWMVAPLQARLPFGLLRNWVTITNPSASEFSYSLRDILMCLLHLFFVGMLGPLILRHFVANGSTGDVSPCRMACPSVLTSIWQSPTTSVPPSAAISAPLANWVIKASFPQASAESCAVLGLKHVLIFSTLNSTIPEIELA